MIRSDDKKPVALAVGGALAGGLLLSGSAFSMTPLAQGYLLGAQEAAAQQTHAAHAQDAGEGRCGVARLDQDGDGRVSRAEFAAHHADADDRFAQMDANGDGYVDQAEHDAHKARHGEGKGDMEGKCGEGKCGGAA
ncbi:hypothetical protein LDO32_15025 [Luteimonas sp. Y-2-2-4F]|nr:hypothetical protein [Luteimonas sp. Y-2-2-4F]MCD9033041.1 hypothetical protein [Luteimonas sp. Y-2-2-4F]